MHHYYSLADHGTLNKTGDTKNQNGFDVYLDNYHTYLIEKAKYIVFSLTIPTPNKKHQETQRYTRQ